MNTQDEPQTPRRRHWASRTHRIFGVSSLLFLVLLALSGLILNHADGLGLSRHAVGPWLLSIYGAEVPPVDSAFAAGGVTFATSADTLYANGVEFAKNADLLIGVVVVDGGIIVATSNEFFVTNSDAALVERYAPDTEGPISRLGIENQRVIVATEDAYSEFDPLRMSLSAPISSTVDSIAWSLPTILSDEQAQQIGTAVLGQAFNWERVLLDLHSGRILPTVGRYIADITALCLLYMCFSGFVLWTRRR